MFHGTPECGNLIKLEIFMTSQKLDPASLIKWNDTEIAFKHLDDLQLKRANFLFSTMSYPTVTGVGIWLVRMALKLNIPIRSLIKMTLFNQFCGGETIDGCSKVVNMLAKHNIGTVLDYAVEAKENETDFNKTYREIKNTISHAKGKYLPFAVFKIELSNN